MIFGYMEDYQRLKQVIAEIKYREKITQKAISEALGFRNQSYLSDMANGRFPVTSDISERISELYTYISKSWLLTGEGDMLIEDANTDTDTISDTDIISVPLLPISAQGGTLNDFVVSVKESECERVISPIKGADFAMTVSGDSMAPEYPSGSQIFIKKINEQAFIEWGKVYVLDTCNGSVIKILAPSDKEGFVKCLSINEDPKYASFEVEWNDIYGVYRVLLCMSLK